MAVEKSKVIFVLGPTATGKTDLAVELAEEIGEIISVDSMQVYKGMDCGTAKPSLEQMRRVKHHLISIVPPDYRFSAGDFKRQASKIIDEIVKRGKIPFLVGGTGLYFKAIEEGIVDAPPADIEYRERLYRLENENKGILHNRLKEVDPESAERIHPNDLVRIVRALEIFHLTGVPFSSYIKRQVVNDFDILKIGLNLPREVLYKRIEDRCYRMIECGLADEVVHLLKLGYDERYPSMKGLGYSHFLSYLKGCLNYEETVRIFMRDTRRFAKRQLTWFKKVKNVKWFRPDVPDDRRRIKELIYDFIGS